MANRISNGLNILFSKEMREDLEILLLKLGIKMMRLLWSLLFWHLFLGHGNRLCDKLQILWLWQEYTANHHSSSPSLPILNGQRS